MKSSAPPPAVDDYANVLAAALTFRVAAKAATAAQRRVLKQVERIQGLRKELKAWEAYASRHQQRLDTELQPLRVQLHQQQRQLVLTIDAVVSQTRGRGSGMPRAHRALLREMLVGYASALQRQGPDKELEALLARHAPDQQADDMQFATNYLMDVLGTDLGSGGGPVQIMLVRADRMLEQLEALPGCAAAEAEADKQEALWQAAQKEADVVLREVRDTLLAGLKPGRQRDLSATPGAPPRAPLGPKERKRLSQEVKRAYEAGDLVTLLGQALVLRQLDVARLFPNGRAGSCEKALQQQALAWQDKLDGVWESYAPLVGRGLPRLHVPAVDQQLTNEIRRLEKALHEVRHDIQAVQHPKDRRVLLNRITAQRERRMQTAMLMALDLFTPIALNPEPEPELEPLGSRK